MTNTSNNSSSKANNQGSNNPERKKYYYIGFRFDMRYQRPLINYLYKVKKSLIQASGQSTTSIIKVKNPVKMFHTRFLYLGYLDLETGTKITDYLKVYLKYLYSESLFQIF